MAYSNVGVPTFYIDNYLYRKTVGATDEALHVEETDEEGASIVNSVDLDLFTLRPSSSKEIDSSSNFDIMIPRTGSFNFRGNMSCYVAILNHTSSAGSYISNADYYSDDLTDSTESTNTFRPIINFKGENSKNGSTILSSHNEGRGSSYIGVSFTTNSPVKIGAISTGIKYKMFQSPELDISMEIENDGYKSITTSSGADITNIHYTGAPLWNNGENFTNPFEIYEGVLDVRNTGAISNGRRSWVMKFKFMSDKNVFSSNYKHSYYSENGTSYDSSDYVNNDSLRWNINEDDSFVAQVWNKTLGGALPFMFQPDSNNYNNIYMCKFNQSSLKVEQVAAKTYSVSLNITEVW